jgi:aquaglyceroporin related protein
MVSLDDNSFDDDARPNSKIAAKDYGDKLPEDDYTTTFPNTWMRLR